jgi:peptide/nickel transport system permease protein
VFQKEKERWYSAPLAATEYRERRAQALEHGPHLLGTDSAGEDVFYLTLKGVRTALFIGMFTTLIIIPVAAFMGIVAGYFRGWIDDTVQLLYTMLASIPEILLLVSLMIVLGRGLPQLCFALGVTSWVGLCRLVRGETLKLRELEFVQGSKALGAGTARLLWSHILPNVMHIIVIAFVLRFSGLVMTEVVLSYLGIGVAPGTGSWGLMIDAARLELARDPIVWWSLAAAFGAMFLLILSFNYFGDVLRDALDPRLRER